MFKLGLVLPNGISGSGGELIVFSNICSESNFREQFHSDFGIDERKQVYLSATPQMRYSFRRCRRRDMPWFTEACGFARPSNPMAIVQRVVSRLLCHIIAFL
jgi:hypothetical protein